MIADFLIAFLVFVLVMEFVVSPLLRKKARKDSWWKEYNDGLDRYANDPEGREAFVDRMTGTTGKQRHAEWKAEEERNDLVYKASRRK